MALPFVQASFTPAAPTPAPVAPAVPTAGDLGAAASAGGSSAGGNAAPAAASVPAATPAQPTAAATPGASGPAAGGQFNDPQWVESLLSSLGDVDMSDPSIQVGVAWAVLGRVWKRAAWLARDESSGCVQLVPRQLCAHILLCLPTGCA